MNPTYRKLLITAAIVLIGAFILKDMLFQPGIGELPGNFNEVAFVRNEQNKGGIIRIYAISVSDTTNAAYLACGDLMPHNEYGSKTTVYFFEKGKPTPDVLQLDTPHFDRLQYHPVAVYIKNEQGVASLTTTP